MLVRFSLQLTRQSSVAYLASFLARGSFVDASLVSSALQALLDWAARYLDEHVDGSTLTASTPQTVSAGASTPGSKVRAWVPIDGKGDVWCCCCPYTFLLSLKSVCMLCVCCRSILLKTWSCSFAARDVVRSFSLFSCE